MPPGYEPTPSFKSADAFDILLKVVENTIDSIIIIQHPYVGCTLACKLCPPAKLSRYSFGLAYLKFSRENMILIH